MESIMTKIIFRKYEQEEIKMIQDNLVKIKNFLIEELIPYASGYIVFEYGEKTSLNFPYALEIWNDSKEKKIIFSSKNKRTRFFLTQEGMVYDYDIYFMSEAFSDENSYDFKYNIQPLYDLCINWKNGSNLKDEIEKYIKRRKKEVEILKNFEV